MPDTVAGTVRSLVRAASEPGTTLMVYAFAVLGLSVAVGIAMPVVALGVGAAAAMAAWHQLILRWPHVIAFILGVALLIPFGRYSLPADLPFELDAYRLVVAVALLFWAASLLSESDVRLRRTPFDVPLAVITGAIAGSICLNLKRVVPLESAVLKSLTFFVSFILVYYFVVSVVRTRRTVETLTKLLVAGTAIVAGFALVEQRTGFNTFDHVNAVLPFLQFNGPVEAERNGLIRAVASAQHPIALGVLFAMTIPVALVLALGSSRRWWIAAALLSLGLMSTVSRTPILVLAAGGVMLLWLRPRTVGPLVPLIVPLIVVTTLVLPGSIATVKNAFLPPGGIVAEQAALAPEADPTLAGGRVRQLGPMLVEASRTPLLGQGFGTRQTGFFNPLRNAPILDNQWLGQLLETGIVGVVGWAALFVVAIRRLARTSRERANLEGWLAAGFAASLTGFAVGMFTYDSLAFSQATFVLWLVLALSASLLLTREGDSA